MILTGTVEQVVMLTNGNSVVFTNQVNLILDSVSGDWFQTYFESGFWIVFTMVSAVIAVWLVRKFSQSIGSAFNRR